MSRAVVIAIDPSNAAKSALNWAVENLSNDTFHLVHCFKPLQAAVGPHYAIVPTGRQDTFFLRLSLISTLTHGEKEQEDWKAKHVKILEVCAEIVHQVSHLPNIVGFLFRPPPDPSLAL